MTIELENVTLRRDGVDFLMDVSLVLEPGDFNILLGPTLSGKTTLLRTMAGLEKPDTGRVLDGGTDVTGVPVQKRNVAMVYQQFINYPSMTVFENIASPLRVAGESRAEVERRVGEVATLLKLEAMLGRRPSELSGGQQQRAALARALVKQAGLVLLDEPLANLDYKLREELRNELPRLFEDTGSTVVYATAEPAEALMLGGHTATLHEGGVTQFGVTHEVFRNPVDLITAKTFSDPPLNVAHVVKRGDTFAMDEEVTWSVGGKHASLPDGEYRLGFRPHHLSLKAGGEHAISLEGKVEIAEISGSETFVHLDVGSHQWVSQSHGVHRLDVGQKLTVSVNPERFILFSPDGRSIDGRQ
jgi:glycerol transport system ATP-binding protein